MDLSQFFTTADFIGIVPETILTVTALSVLTLEMARVSRPWIILSVAVLGLLLSAAAAFITSGNNQILFGGMLKLNQISLFFDILYISIGLITLIFSQGYLEKRGSKSRGEYPALILFAVIGMMLMTRANDLVIVFLGLELLSISLYVLVGFLRHDNLSNESGLKYLLLGAFATGFFLFGAAFTYGATGTTNYDGIVLAIANDNILSKIYLVLGIGLLLIGFAFKVALVPFHMWSPDVYQGAPTTVTGFLCTAPKAAGFGALLILFNNPLADIHYQWQDIFWLLAVLTMTVGNVTALVQSNVKRMLAFSSISHAGFLVMGILVLNVSSISAVLFYLVTYSVINLGSFAIISSVEREENGLKFKDYRGLGLRYPWLAAAMTIFMISLAGFPPTAGFVAKYGLFSAAIAEGYVWLVVIAVLNTLISVYYYLRLVINMYMKEEENALISSFNIIVIGLIWIMAAMMIILGITPGFLLEITAEAANFTS
ncbi:MAG: NADH-quinone oxidoreductase subunit N [Candidatus Marinimicrobia bacterium]|jgi:NADH-quinone oxidoreductase subunit N|nr:NADH-quinone oxidoreductase subunit N [Candidatus Neomarinimicrobiota bacterium]MDP7565741.1 NADH-quinone oxidoreductase subunit N [Candidatus Neomarinimicrobiota bacterium]|tara:strand:+ start:8240 stop:9694 length:1455 start_codon:yes stop_codon:yes gene_type:complete